MKRKNLFYLFLSTTFTFSMLSCSSNEEVNNDNNSSFEKIMQSNPNQEILLDLDFSMMNSSRLSFDVYSEYPYEKTSNGEISIKSNLKPIVSAMTDDNGKFKLSRIIPGNIDKLYAISNAVGTPLLMTANVSNGKALFNEVNTTQSNTDSRSISNFNKLGTWNKYGKPDYIDNNFKNKLSGKEYNSITSALPEWKKVNVNLCKSNGIHVSKKGKIWVSVISNKSLFNNSLGYYCYNDGSSKGNIKEIIAFPSTTTYNILNGLKCNQYIQLKYYDNNTGKLCDEFPAGTNIGFVLHTSSFSFISGSVNNGNNQFYSNSSWNIEKNNKNHAAIFATANKNIIMGFEDLNNDIFGDNDCNDVVFNIASDNKDVISLNMPVVNNEEDVVKKEVVKSVRSLKDIIPSSASSNLFKDLYVKTTSVISILNGNVVAVKDEMYISNKKNIYGLLLDDFTSNMIVCSDIYSRVDHHLTGMLHTTIKRSKETSAVRSISDGDIRPASDVIMDILNGYKYQIKDNKTVIIDISYEFMPIPYAEFITTVPVAPFTPFILNE